MTETSKRYRTRVARETAEQAAVRKLKYRDYIKAKRARETAELIESRLKKRADLKRLQYSKKQYVEIGVDGSLKFVGAPTSPVPKSVYKAPTSKFRHNTVFIFDEKKPYQLPRQVSPEEAASIIMNAKAVGEACSDFPFPSKTQPGVRRRLVVVESDSESDSDSDTDTDGMLQSVSLLLGFNASHL